MQMLRISFLSSFLFIINVGVPYSQERPTWDKHGESITDGCSVPQFAVTASDEIKRVNKKVRDCCVTHDKAYYEGKQPEYAERIKADKALKKCIQSKDEKGWAHGFYIGVRAGGCSIRKQSYRWGFGKDWILEGVKPVYKSQYSKNEANKALLLPCIRR